MRKRSPPPRELTPDSFPDTTEITQTSDYTFGPDALASVIPLIKQQADKDQRFRAYWSLADLCIKKEAFDLAAEIAKIIIDDSDGYYWHLKHAAQILHGSSADETLVKDVMLRAIEAIERGQEDEYPEDIGRNKLAYLKNLAKLYMNFGMAQEATALLQRVTDGYSDIRRFHPSWSKTTTSDLVKIASWQEQLGNREGSVSALRAAAQWAIRDKTPEFANSRLRAVINNQSAIGEFREAFRSARLFTLTPDKAESLSDIAYWQNEYGNETEARQTFGLAISTAYLDTREPYSGTNHTLSLIAEKQLKAGFIDDSYNTLSLIDPVVRDLSVRRFAGILIKKILIEGNAVVAEHLRELSAGQNALIGPEQLTIAMNSTLRDYRRSK